MATSRVRTYAEICQGGPTTTVDLNVPPLGVQERANDLFVSNPGAIRIYGIVHDSRCEEWEGIMAHPNGATVEGTFTGFQNITDAQISTPPPRECAFSGTVVSGRFEGYGTFVSNEASYTGHFEGGCPNGTGEYTESCEVRSSGDSGNQTQLAELSESSQEGGVTVETTYCGTWKNGILHGDECTMRRAGFEYRGGFVDGKPHGQGAVKRISQEMRRFVVRYDQGTEVDCVNEVDAQNAELRTLLAESTSMCKVCFAMQATVVFVPCRHMCVCNNCFERLPKQSEYAESESSLPGRVRRRSIEISRCPVCRTTIKDVVHAIVS